MIPGFPAALPTGSPDRSGPDLGQLQALAGPFLEAWRSGDPEAPATAWDRLRPAGDGAFRMEAGLLAGIVRGLLDLDPEFAQAVLDRLDVPQVQGDLDLGGCAGLVRFPAAVQVVLGRADLSGCPDLAGFGPELMVAGDLDLSRCLALASLPGSLKVLGRLSLEGCGALRQLPPRLTVRGGSGAGPALDLSGCRSWDRRLPPGLGPLLQVRFPSGVRAQVWRLRLEGALSSLWLLGGLLGVGILGLCLAPWAGVPTLRIMLRIALILGYAYVFLQAVRRRRRKG
jgi:hypothetical protein